MKPAFVISRRFFSNARSALLLLLYFFIIICSCNTKETDPAALDGAILKDLPYTTPEELVMSPGYKQMELADLDISNPATGDSIVIECYYQGCFPLPLLRSVITKEKEGYSIKWLWRHHDKLGGYYQYYPADITPVLKGFEDSCFNLVKASDERIAKDSFQAGRPGEWYGSHSAYSITYGTKVWLFDDSEFERWYGYEWMSYKLARMGEHEEYNLNGAFMHWQWDLEHETDQ